MKTKQYPSIYPILQSTRKMHSQNPLNKVKLHHLKCSVFIWTLAMTSYHKNFFVPSFPNYQKKGPIKFLQINLPHLDP